MPKKISKHLKSMTKLHWNKLPSWMTWLSGYRLDEGFHSQQHAVNYVLLCLIANAEAVLHLCIDEFRLLYQISVIFPPAGWQLKFLLVYKLRWIFWSDSFTVKSITNILCLYVSVTMSKCYFYCFFFDSLLWLLSPVNPTVSVTAPVAADAAANRPCFCYCYSNCHLYWCWCRTQLSPLLSPQITVIILRNIILQNNRSFSVAMSASVAATHSELMQHFLLRIIEVQFYSNRLLLLLQRSFVVLLTLVLF